MIKIDLQKPLTAGEIRVLGMCTDATPSKSVLNGARRLMLLGELSDRAVEWACAYHAATKEAKNG